MEATICLFVDLVAGTTRRKPLFRDLYLFTDNNDANYFHENNAAKHYRELNQALRKPMHLISQDDNRDDAASVQVRSDSS